MGTRKEIRIKMSPIQKWKLDRLPKEERKSYIASLMGIRRSPFENVTLLSKHNKSKDSLHACIDVRLKDHYLKRFMDQFKVMDHRPESNLTYFGVEIECILDYSSLGVSDLDDRMIECPDCCGSGTVTYIHRESAHEIEGECPYCEGSGEVENEDPENRDMSEIFQEVKNVLKEKIKEYKIRGVNIKEDGSIKDLESDEIGVEFSILVPSNNFENLKRLCQLLEDLDARVNKTCGLHVHIDARKMNRDEAINRGGNLASYLIFLKRMVPETRRTNTYCKLQASTTDRYSAVNLQALDKYNTVEIRLHSATTNYEKISRWVEILNVLWSSPERDSRSFELFLSKFTEETQKYIRSRVALFWNQEEVPEGTDSEDTNYLEDQLGA